MSPPSYVSFSICILLMCTFSCISPPMYLPFLYVSPFLCILICSLLCTPLLCLPHSYVSPSYVSLLLCIPLLSFSPILCLPLLCLPPRMYPPFYMSPLLCTPSLYLNNKISCMNIRPAPITLFRRIIYIYRPFFSVLIWNCIYSYLILFLDKVVHPD